MSQDTHYFPNIHPTANLWGGTVVGEGTSIGAFCDLGAVAIGQGCKIQCSVSIPPGWIIGNNVFIGPGARFANDQKPDLSKKKFRPLLGVVEDNAVIGMNASIGAGLRICEGAVVGMGAVVTKDIAPGITVVGNPARILEPH